MKTFVCGAMLFTFCLMTDIGYSADYSVKVLDEAPPTGDLPASVGEQLATTGVRVIRGTSTTYCDIWLCREWAVQADFKPTPALLYPFKPGQLIGVVRFARKGADFRDQEIEKGLYTLRYARQPVDGAHVGTSPTYDFLLLVRAEDEESSELTEQTVLNVRSKTAVGSNHPGLLSMRPLVSQTNYPAIRHVEESDWWIVGLSGMARTDTVKAFPFDLVIAGQAAE